MISKFHYTVLCTLATSTSLFVAQPAQATEPPDASRLVRELGSPVFREREKADAELLRLGESALPALEQGLKSSELEISSRCERLISKIRYTIRKEAEEKRLREFVRSGLHAKGKSTPNWERFQKLIDGDPKARALFIELHEYDAVFLKLAVETPERVPAWASTRRNELTDEARRLEQSGKNPALIWPEVRMMVKQALALPNPDLNLLDETYRFGRLSGCEYDPAIMGMYRLRLSEQLALLVKQATIDKSVISRLRLRANDLGMEKELLDSVRPIAAAVIVRILSSPFDKTHQTEADGLFEFALWYEVKGIAPMALKVGLSKEFDTDTRRMAVHMVGKYGTREQIAPLNQLLGDRTPLYEFGKVQVCGAKFTSYLCDEALAAMVHLSGGDLEDYGFNKPGVPAPKFSYGSIYGRVYFGPSEEVIDVIRQQAILKWTARQDSVRPRK